MAGWTPQDIWATIRRARLIRVLIIYVGASFATLQMVDVFVQQLGIPDWFFPGAIVLLIVGLPIIVATALVQSAPAPAPESEPASAAFESASMIPELAAAPEPRVTTAADVAGVARHWLTWRKAIMGGVLAFAIWGVVVTAYMTMRTLGIGPVGSLVAAGVIDPGEPIILSDFENNTGDSLLAVVVTEAFRIDFSQSPLIQVMRPAQVGQVLARMEKNPESLLDLDLALAREIAMREGVGAVIGGEIGTAGSSFVISVRLVSAETDELLAAFRETADDSSSIIKAVDRLSNRMRERIGESLKTIRRSEPLEKVTTSSMEALRKYTQAVRVSEIGGDEARGLTLFEEAIALDTTFAMAYRGLAIGLGNMFQERDRQVAAMGKAYEYRQRLTERERYLTIAQYHTDVTGDRNAAINAFRSLLDIRPNDRTALNNLGVVYADMGDYEQAADLYLSGIEADSSNPIPYGNAVDMLYALGRLDEMRAILAVLDEKFPGNPFGVFRQAALASAEGDYEAAERHIAGMKEAGRGNLAIQADASGWLSRIAQVRGQLTDAERHLGDAMAANAERGLPAEYVGNAVALGFLEVQIRGSGGQAVRRIDDALARYPWASLAPLDRPYTAMASLVARAGDPERAQKLIAEFEAEIQPELRRDQEPWRHLALADIAIAEGRDEDAIAELRIFHRDRQGWCRACGNHELARAFEVMGEADSAVAHYEAYITTPWIWRLFWDVGALALTYERLGTLYEARGDAEKAIYYYGKLVDLWEDADPELQPRVESARRAIQALSADR